VLAGTAEVHAVESHTGIEKTGRHRGDELRLVEIADRALDECVAVDVRIQRARKQLLTDDLIQRRSAPRSAAGLQPYRFRTTHVEVEVERATLVVANRLVVELSRAVSVEVGSEEETKV